MQLKSHYLTQILPNRSASVKRFLLNSVRPEPLYSAQAVRLDNNCCEPIFVLGKCIFIACLT